MQVAAIAFDRFKPLQDDACESRIVAAKAALGKRSVSLGSVEGDLHGIV